VSTGLVEAFLTARRLDFPGLARASHGVGAVAIGQDGLGDALARVRRRLHEFQRGVVQYVACHVDASDGRDGSRVLGG